MLASIFKKPYKELNFYKIGLVTPSMKKLAPQRTPYKNRTVARLAVVQALFQIEQTKASPPQVIIEFLKLRVKDVESGLRKVDTTFFSKIVEQAWKEHERSDQIIQGALKEGWTLDRIEPVTRAILRAALCEILETQTPTAVIIDEYLNLTRDFFDKTEVSFVNGILNTVANKVRSE